MSQPISDKKFLEFKWPRKMASWQPKKKKHYEHRVIITSQSNPEYAYVLKFSNDRKAKNHVKSAKEADNIIAIEYEKRVIPEITEEGVIL